MKSVISAAIAAGILAVGLTAPNQAMAIRQDSNAGYYNTTYECITSYPDHGHNNIATKTCWAITSGSVRRPAMRITTV